MPPELYGPTGALIALAVAVAALWREHLKADADDRQQRDRAMDIAAASTDATRRMADAWEQRNRDDANRRRRTDRDADS